MTVDEYVQMIREVAAAHEADRVTAHTVVMYRDRRDGEEYPFHIVVSGTGEAPEGVEPLQRKALPPCEGKKGWFRR